MDCDVIRPELTAFHFGEIEAEARERVEAHLPACPACLQAYLALKRRIEAADGRLSETARARLRGAVEREVVAHNERAQWSWWQRPLAVALAAAAVLFAASTSGSLAASPGGAPLGWSRSTAAPEPE